MMLIFILMISFQFVTSDDGSYSYQRFRGPVSGQIQKISVPPHHYSTDYVAKPDYSYSYGIEDPATGISQTHEETRDGDIVSGEYTVLQADGIIRIVKYTADDENGFRADIRYEIP